MPAPFPPFDLSDPKPLCAHAREGLSKDAALFAWRLARSAYLFDWEEWMRAGYTDITVQAEHKLLRGLGELKEERRLRDALLQKWQLMQARRAASGGAFSAAAGLMRQAWESDAGKAAVLLKKLPDGGFAVLIGFAGTGKHLYDWMPNLRFAHPDGFHAGFDHVARLTRKNAKEIFFPAAARALGVESLSFEDVLNSMKRPGSPFRLFLAGHSRGAAAVQMFVYRALQEGVLSEYMTGYGFAAPTVYSGPSTAYTPPVLLINNSDDLVTRIGLSGHAGRVFLYPADERIRRACYRPEPPMFRDMLSRLAAMRGTEDALTAMYALVSSLCYLSVSEEDALPLPGIAEAAAAAGVPPMLLARRFLRDAFYDAMGKEPDEGTVVTLCKEYVRLLKKEGVMPVLSALRAAAFSPHHLYASKEDAPAAYQYIVTEGFGELKEAR